MDTPPTAVIVADTIVVVSVVVDVVFIIKDAMTNSDTNATLSSPPLTEQHCVCAVTWQQWGRCTTRTIEKYSTCKPDPKPD